jgi:hypothetical protein
VITANGVARLPLTASKTYYIGVSNGKSQNSVKFAINKEANVYTWEVIGGPEGMRSGLSSASVTRGYTYQIIFLY